MPGNSPLSGLHDLPLPIKKGGNERRREGATGNTSPAKDGRG